MFLYEKLAGVGSRVASTEKIIGVGTDIEKTSRFKRVGPHFISTVFTEREFMYCESRHNPHIHYAARFVGKEAVIKALSNAHIKVGFDQIEILNNEFGVPKVNYARSDLNKKFSTHLSLAHTSDKALAFVVITKRNRSSG